MERERRQYQERAQNEANAVLPVGRSAWKVYEDDVALRDARNASPVPIVFLWSTQLMEMDGVCSSEIDIRGFLIGWVTLKGLTRLAA